MVLKCMFTGKYLTFEYLCKVTLINFLVKINTLRKKGFVDLKSTKLNVTRFIKKSKINSTL